ncbi:KAP family P-loop NTPase fold protein [Aeromonas hydrophila]|uniref:KAP family P-loop NTPase fold protein n=1 Tax=Aeromonas hydrophila TaxID=644 RepID=UPI003D1FBAFC
MSHSLLVNAKYSSWKESHTFDNCKLNRKDYGHFLANYLIGEKDGFVLNLNGSWGTGKTEFLKRFYAELMDRGHPTIYIDAWESDFSQEPLTVVASELLNQLERLMDGAISDGAITEVKRALGKALKGTLVGLAGIASARLLNDSSIGMETVNKLLDEAPQNITKQLAEDYQSQIEAIINTREALGSLAESLQNVNGSKLPVIVLIDELDRCRPTYAIEMLEVIKHFFSIKGFVFVIATDTEQLCHSITSVYGNNFDSSQYLKRFFNRKASLPTPRIYEYIQARGIDFERYVKIRAYPDIKRGSSFDQFAKQTISLLSDVYQLKIRDIDQLIDKLHSCLRSAEAACSSSDKTQYINIVALIIGLIEQDINATSFHERRHFNNVMSPIKNESIELAKDLNIKAYINLCMESVILIRDVGEDRYGRPMHSQCLPLRAHYRGFLNDDPSIEIINLVDILSNMSEVHNSERPGVKVWLWPDIKKSIELAGNIE